MVFNNSYKDGGGADYACNKIAFYGAGNTPTTTANNGFGVATGGVEYFSGLNHAFYTGTTGGTGYGTERMRITSTGNVGIGTNNPTNILQVGGGGRLRISNGASDYTLIGTVDADSGNNARILLSAIDRGGGLAGGNIEYLSTASGSHIFSTTSSITERMRITSTGNVGIGTAASGTSDTAKLYIINSSTAANHLAGTIGIWLFNPTNSAGQNSVICNKIGGPLAGKVIYSWDIANTWGCSIVANGNDTNKMMRFNDLWDGSGVDRMTINNLNGNVVIGGNLNVGSLTNPSDSRIKKDIEDINDESALNKLLLIQPTTYNYIDVERNKGFGKIYGFIAQQIKDVIPEAVPIIEYIIPNIYKSCLINNKREVYHSIPLDTPIDTDIKIKESMYKIKEIYEDYFVIDKDIEDVEAFVYGYNINDFHTLDKTYIFTLNVCATQELHRRIEAQSVLLKSQDDRIKDLETKVATLMSSM